MLKILKKITAVLCTVSTMSLGALSVATVVNVVIPDSGVANAQEADADETSPDEIHQTDFVNTLISNADGIHEDTPSIPTFSSNTLIEMSPDSTQAVPLTKPLLPTEPVPAEITPNTPPPEENTQNPADLEKPLNLAPTLKEKKEEPKVEVKKDEPKPEPKKEEPKPVPNPEPAPVKAPEPAVQPKPETAPVAAVETPKKDDTDTDVSFKRGSCPSSTGTIDKLFPISKKLGLPNEVIPDLVEIHSKIPTNGNKSVCLERDTAQAFYDLYTAAKQDGVYLKVSSGYRSYERQMGINANSPLSASVITSTQKPGHSEHHMGTALDITGKTIGYAAVSPQFDDTSEMVWMNAHAHEYGFVLSYTKGSETDTGIIYEPWHWRFVGKGPANEIHMLNLVPTAYLEALKERDN